MSSNKNTSDEKYQNKPLCVIGSVLKWNILKIFANNVSLSYQRIVKRTKLNINLHRIILDQTKYKSPSYYIGPN